MAISKQLNIGRAGEYLVLADLLLKGYQAFDSGQGVNYDLVMESKDNKLLKIQVKTTEEIKNWRPNYSKSQKSYFFHIKRTRKNGNRKYTEKDFDLYALVMLDIKQIAYLVNKNIDSESITLRDRNLKYYNEQKSRYFQDLTLEKALKELENV